MLEYVGTPSGAIFQISLLGHCPWVRNSGTKVPNWCQRVWSSRHSSRPGVTLPVLSKVEIFPVREPSLRRGGDSYKIVAFNLKPDQRRPVSLPVSHPDSDSCCLFVKFVLYKVSLPFSHPDSDSCCLFVKFVLYKVSIPVSHPDNDSVRVLFPILAATPCDGDEGQRERNDSAWFHCG